MDPAIQTQISHVHNHVTNKPIPPRSVVVNIAVEVIKGLVAIAISTASFLLSQRMVFLASEFRAGLAAVGIITAIIGALILKAAAIDYNIYRKASLPFPFNKELQKADGQFPCFSYGNLYALGWCIGVNESKKLKKLNAKELYIEDMGTARNCHNQRSIVIVRKNALSHPEFSVKLQTHEAEVLLRMLLLDGYTINKSGIISPSKLYSIKVDDSDKSDEAVNINDPKEKLLKNLRFVEVGVEKKTLHPKKTPEELIPNLSFMLGRNLEEITPEFEERVGYVSATVHYNGKWFCCLLFKKKDISLLENIKTLQQELSTEFKQVESLEGPPKGYTPASYDFSKQNPGGQKCLKEYFKSHKRYY